MIWSAGKKLKNGLYTIEGQPIGHGRLSLTYLAKTKEGNRIVIKVPNDEASQVDLERVQGRFVKEAFKLQQCQHPHIVKVFDPFQEEHLWCIPMEYVAGMTLDKRDRRRLSEVEAITYVTQIGEALTVLHGKNLIHRDVNPSNVILRVREGKSEAVLIDFGLVRDFSTDASSVTTHTQAGDMMPSYKAPELYVPNGDRGPFCDLYALGAMLYELVTGDLPPNAIERSEKPGPLSFPGNGVSERVIKSIESAMAMKASGRPDSVAEWLEQLDSGKFPDVTPESTPRKPINWKMVITVITAITGLVTAGTGMISAFQPKDSSPKPSEKTR